MLRMLQSIPRAPHALNCPVYSVFSPPAISRSVQPAHYSSSSPANISFFKEVLSRFPPQRCLVFAYGSGVFRQEGHKDTKDNMTDFIFAVHDTEQWHKENLALHPMHYSTMARLMGPGAI